MKKPHVHAELIKAWADGAEIEYRDRQNPWVPMPTHGDWEDFFEYRIKPELKPDVVVYGHFAPSYLSKRFDSGYHNLQLTFDGETGKLKAAKVL